MWFTQVHKWMYIWWFHIDLVVLNKYYYECETEFLGNVIQFSSSSAVAYLGISDIRKCCQSHSVSGLNITFYIIAISGQIGSMNSCPFQKLQKNDELSTQFCTLDSYWHSSIMRITGIRNVFMFVLMFLWWQN